MRGLELGAINPGTLILRSRGKVADRAGKSIPATVTFHNYPDAAGEGQHCKCRVAEGIRPSEEDSGVWHVPEIAYGS